MAAHNSRHIRRLGFSSVTELHWGESADVAGVRVTAIEVAHWGERFPWSHWHGYNAYLLERNGSAILFGGDTAYTDSFRKACAGRRIQLAILPIGGYEPWIQSHASPEQAWQMFQEIGAEYLAPIHHQTFILSHEPPEEPLRRMLAVAGGDARRVVLREVGQTFTLS
jgi:L-ascorbate metabolism protein UlaG (beta-lactamase superfamily)